MEDQERSWNIVAGVAAVLAAMVARKVATETWKRLGKSEPPVNPADRSVGWGEAIGWAVFAGVLAGAARVIGRRGAAAAWEKTTGNQPPTIT